MSNWNEKQAKKAEFSMNKALDDGYGQTDFEGNADKDVRGAAMGHGDEELFEKRMSKAEKKAAAAAKRDAKRTARDAKNGKTKEEPVEEEKESAGDLLAGAKAALPQKKLYWKSSPAIKLLSRTKAKRELCTPMRVISMLVGSQ
jgi:hypothetical protein